MSKIILISLAVFLIVCSPIEAQGKKVENIKNNEIVGLLNNLEIVSELQTSELKIRIIKTVNLSGSASTKSSEVTHDIYIAVSELDELPIQNLYIIRNLYNPRDLIWLSTDSIPEFRIDHASRYHTRTARFLIHTDYLERLY